MVQRSVAAILAAAALAAGLWAQEAASPGLAFELGIGTATLPTDPRDPISETNPQLTFQKLALMPELSFGKFGVGLDLTVHFNLRLGTGSEGIEFYEPDWNPEKAGKSFLELYLPKIAFVRWGTKGEPLFAKLGSFNDGTLGNGFIMGNYANVRFLPETRIFGAALDLDGSLFAFPWIGIETFVGNLARFDVAGSRLFVRPLAGTELPILKDMQVGATAAVDREPLLYDGNDSTTGDPVAVFGADVRVPIIATQAASLAAFSDLAFQEKGRWGSMVGAGGRVLSVLTYGAQIRLLGPGFVPVYFDGGYDLFRAAKYAALKTEPAGDPFAGWLASLGTSLMNDAIVLNVALDGPFKAAPAAGTIADYPHLRAAFVVADGFLMGFSFDALYEKFYLGAPASVAKGTGDFWRDLVSAENAAIGAKINYKTGPAVISLLYNLRYDPTAPKGFVVTSSLMSSIRF